MNRISAYGLKSGDYFIEDDKYYLTISDAIMIKDHRSSSQTIYEIEVQDILGEIFTITLEESDKVELVTQKEFMSHKNKLISYVVCRIGKRDADTYNNYAYYIGDDKKGNPVYKYRAQDSALKFIKKEAERLSRLHQKGEEYYIYKVMKV